MSMMIAGVAGLALGVGGAVMQESANSRARNRVRDAANMPGLDVGASINEVSALMPQTNRLEQGRNTFNQQEITRILEGAIPGFSEGQAQRTNNALSMLRGELPDDVLAEVQRRSNTRALEGGYAGTGFGRNLTARDIGRTSLDLTREGADLFQGIIGSTPTMTPVDYTITPDEMVSLRSGERNTRQSILASIGNMPQSGAATAGFMSNLGSGLMTGGMDALGRRG